MRGDDRGAVVHAAALVLDQSLREKCSGHPARELAEPIDDRVHGLDLADGQHPRGDRWVEVRARDDGQCLHEHEQHEHVHEPDHREVDERLLAIHGWRYVQAHHHRDEEDEGKRAEELGDEGGWTSIRRLGHGTTSLVGRVDGAAA